MITKVSYNFQKQSFQDIFRKCMNFDLFLNIVLLSLDRFASSLNAMHTFSKTEITYLIFWLNAYMRIHFELYLSFYNPFRIKVHVRYMTYNLFPHLFQKCIKLIHFKIILMFLKKGKRFYTLVISPSYQFYRDGLSAVRNLWSLSCSLICKIPDGLLRGRKVFMNWTIFFSQPACYRSYRHFWTIFEF